MNIAIIIGLAAAVATALGGLFAIRFKDKLHLFLGFSAGAVLAVALFDLIPESIELSSTKYDLDIVMLFIAIGFVIFMILDRFLAVHSHEEEHCDNPIHKKSPFGAAAFCFHSFLDGLGIGLAFKVSPSVGWIIAAAVLTHSFSDGINTVNIVLKNKLNTTIALKWLIVDAAAPAIGVFVAMILTLRDTTLGLILAIFTGFFLYIGASDLIPESHHKHPTVLTTLMTILGLAVLYFAIRVSF